MTDQSGSKKRRSQRDYSLTFKLQVVSEVEKGESSYSQAQKKYGIQGNSTVLVWLRKHGTLDWKMIKPEVLSKSKQQTPEQRIKELETLLKAEQEKSLLYKTIIDIAEQQYGMVLRKKSSPKLQSNSSNQED